MENLTINYKDRWKRGDHYKNKTLGLERTMQGRPRTYERKLMSGKVWDSFIMTTLLYEMIHMGK
jgi:hypothetical protein